MKRKTAPAQKKPALKRQKTQGSFYPTQAKALSLLSSELKYNDTAFVIDATTTGAVVSLSSLAAGDTVLLRDGNKINVKSFELRIRLEMEATTVNGVVRFLLVRDKQANNVAITAVNNVLDTISPESLRLIANMSRYDILMDKTISLNATSPTATSFQKYFIKKYVKVPQDDKAVTSFIDGNSGVPNTNSYSLLYLSDLPTGVTDVNVFGQCRMRFVG